MIIVQAEEYLRSDPVLWIPSEVWFGFLARRVHEIQRTQIAIVRRRPPNLGILTSILNHMLHSTISTPIVFDSHLRESLALLEYRNVLETAGMFFLQEFDLSSDTCLYDVQQQDDITVLSLMGANTKAQIGKRFKQEPYCAGIDNQHVEKRHRHPGDFELEQRHRDQPCDQY